MGRTSGKSFQREVIQPGVALSCPPLHFLLFATRNVDVMIGAIVASTHQVVIVTMDVLWWNRQEMIEGVHVSLMTTELLYQLWVT